MNKKVFILITTILTFLIFSSNVNALKVGDIIEENKPTVSVDGKKFSTSQISTCGKVSAVDSKGNATYYRIMVNLVQFCEQTKICQKPLLLKDGKSYMIYSYPIEISNIGYPYKYYMFIHEVGGTSFTKGVYLCNRSQSSYPTISYTGSPCYKHSSEGIPTTVDVPSEIHNGAVYVPGRFLAEAFDRIVTYEANTCTMRVMTRTEMSAGK